MSCCIRLACVAWFLATPALAATYEIRPDGSGDFATIQDGVNVAITGDVFELTDGTFTGAGNRDVDYLGKAITIRSQSGDPGACVVDCETLGRGFVFQTFETSASILEGVGITNGVVSGGPDEGAGIRCEDAAPTISGCHVWNNIGNGIHVTGFDAVTVTVEDCVIEGNTGAGIQIQTSARGVISGCTIDTNGDTGITIFNGAEASISDCMIRGNESGTSGGGISALQNANFDLTGSVVTGNLSATLGGGAYVSEGNFEFTSSTFSGNRASRGGGIYVDEDAAANLSRTIVWGNCADDAGDEIHARDLIFAVDFECSNTDPAGIEGGDVNFIGTNVFEDPRFCDPIPCATASTTLGDYTLELGSPCTATESPCGLLIGALDVGCAGPTPVRDVTWGEVKRRFGD